MNNFGRIGQAFHASSLFRKQMLTMSIISYFKESFRRKKARRVTQEYPPQISTFQLENEGPIEFANWTNPLVGQIVIDQGMVDFYKKYIKTGDLVIDIGANIGDTTLPMSLAAGITGTTLGFDPNPLVFKILELNATLNKGKVNIIPLPYAISVNEEEFYYVSEEASFGNGAISPVKESKRWKYVYPGKIKGINLKSFLEREYPTQLDKLTFIKIDTEGYDKEIIKSIPDVIEKYKPVMVAESYGKSSNEEKTELFNCISRFGYELYYMEDFDVNAKTIRINSSQELINWKKTINILALPIK